MDIFFEETKLKLSYEDKIKIYYSYFKGAFILSLLEYHH